MEAFAVCHVHSQWSYDGSLSIDELADRFSRGGYRILMMTEHDRGFTPSRLREYREACARASSGEILVVPGIEYSDAANRVHVLVWGDVPFLGEGLSTTEMLDAARSANGVAVLAHPSRKDAWSSFEPGWADRLLGIEVWNRKYDGWAPSKMASSLLQMGNTVPFVGLDFHTSRQSFPLAMVLDIQGDITEETVLYCLKSRRCHPRAFRVPLDERMFRKALPVLSIVELGRRTAASIVRYSKTFLG